MVLLRIYSYYGTNYQRCELQTNPTTRLLLIRVIVNNYKSQLLRHVRTH